MNLSYFFYVKKNFLIFLFVVFLVMPLFSARNLSDEEQKAIDDLMMFRLNTTTFPAQEAIVVIDLYDGLFISKEQVSKISEEVQLIIENYLVIEEYTCLDEIDPDLPALKTMLETQIKKNEEWFETHKSDEINSWLYCSYSGLISNNLKYLGWLAKIEQGLLVKEYLEKALEQNPDMAFAQMGLAFWYFYAPVISGGSVNTALKFYEQAVSNARNDAELFMAEYYLSQCYFHKGKTKEYNAAMDCLRRLLPENRKVRLLEKLNNAGYSLFDYQDNRAKIEKKLGF